MVKTLSRMLPLGTELPKFDLEVVQNTIFSKNFGSEIKFISNSFFKEKPLLVMIICAHCPFVKHIEVQISTLSLEYKDKIDFVAVSSNSTVSHPQDSPEFLSEQSNLNNWNFPYLFDSDQLLAISLQAACTPEFYLFSPDKGNRQILKYRGQLDESSPGNNIPSTGIAVRNAIDKLLKGETISEIQKPSIGCNIKWHPGSTPEWFSSDLNG